MKIKKISLHNYLTQSIKSISDAFGPERILVASLNKDISEVMSEWKTSKEIPSELEITFFGSDLSRGITPFKGRDILVLVGGPYIPKHAYNQETISEHFEKSSIMINKGLDEQCKASYEQGAMINILGRVKDSTGLNKSIVFALGVTKGEMANFVRVEGVPSPHVTAFPMREATTELFVKAGQLWQNHDWEDAKDIGTVAAIITGMRMLKNASLSKVLRCREEAAEERNQHQEKNRQIVKRNKVILESEGLEVVESDNGGYSFKCS